MIWTQIYDPLGNPWLSTLFRGRAHRTAVGSSRQRRVAQLAALVGLSAAMLVMAIFVFVPALPDTAYAERALAPGAGHAGGSGNGAAFGLLPIGWIVLAAIFLYNLTVEPGSSRSSSTRSCPLSDDRRIQALLIAFCFGAFVEGAAGFGTPVAISAALMMGAASSRFTPPGWRCSPTPRRWPSVPWARRSSRWPTSPAVLARSLGAQLSRWPGRQLPFFSLIVPVWLVWVWPAGAACWASGRRWWCAAAALRRVQFLVANFIGPGWSTWPAAWSRWSAWRCSCESGSPRRSWRFADEAPTARPARCQSTLWRGQVAAPGCRGFC